MFAIWRWWCQRRKKRAKDSPFSFIIPTTTSNCCCCFVSPSAFRTVACTCCGPSRSLMYVCNYVRACLRGDERVACRALFKPIIRSYCLFLVFLLAFLLWSSLSLSFFLLSILSLILINCFTLFLVGWFVPSDQFF